MKIESQNLDHMYIKDQWLFPNYDQDAKLQLGTSSILQSSKSGLEGNRCILQLQIQDRKPKWKIMDVPKNSGHIQIKIKMTNPSQEPPVFSKVSYQDFKDIDVLYTFKIKIESQILEHECIKDRRPYPDHD